MAIGVSQKADTDDKRTGEKRVDDKKSASDVH